MYVGHFSFDGQRKDGPEAGPVNGWFTCIVEAESVEEAVEKLEDLVTAAGGWFASFESVEEVYLDDVTEVEAVPGKGVLTRFTEYHGEPQPSISTSLPNVPDEFCRSYGWGPEEPNPDSDEGVTLEPFVSFRE